MKAAYEKNQGASQASACGNEFVPTNIGCRCYATTAISTSALPNSAFAYKKNQATSQSNACGNDFVPINVGCQNTGSQTQGDENSVALAAQQTFPEVDIEKDHKKKVKPVPPVDVGCTEPFTRWDITIREDMSSGEGVPIGTIICLEMGLGEHEALVILDSAPGKFVTGVNTNQPNQANCNAPRSQVAEVTSGEPEDIPEPLEMGSLLCATVG